jgi:glycosyltransferase involved in cell wall biosynthesis
MKPGLPVVAGDLPMNTPLISIILPTYNRCEMLGGALDSLIGQETGGEFSYEIVVVDNASTDATKAVVDQAARGSPVPVRYFYHEVPGPAPARNRGLAEARGSWLAFFDDDELAAPDWLRQLHRAAVETGAPVVGGAMLLDLPPEELQRLNRFVRRTLLREIDYYPTVHTYTGKFLPGTNNALVARCAFDAVGIFRNPGQSGGSDSDFFLRVRAAGMPLYYTPYAIVRHRIPPNRITVEHLRWDARQGCTTFACLDYEFHGPVTLALVCTARVAHALLVVVPRLAWGWLRRDPAEVLGQRVRLWRAEGYFRRSLALLAPTWFPQHRYFANLDFRKGRIVGHNDAQADATP